MKPTYRRSGWRKGACFQEWGLVMSPGKRRGQPGGGGATGAAPVLSTVFRDPTQQPAHTEPRCPQSSIYCPDLTAAELNSTSSALLQRGGCFACAPFFPQGWSSCPLPLFWGLLPHSCSPFLCRVLPRPCRLEKLYSDSALRVTALTPFHRKQSAAQASVSMMWKGSSPHLLKPFGFTRGGHAIPTQDWAQAGPVLKLPLVQHRTVDHKSVDLVVFPVQPLAMALRVSPQQWRTECAWLQTWSS